MNAATAILFLGIANSHLFPPAFASIFAHRDIHACDQAASNAAQMSDVPVNILRAITRTESGKTQDGQFAGWPWTVNVEGRGMYFKTRKSAERYINEAIERGQTNIDIGCFQINFRWHGQHFNSIASMLDPVQNAHYAAQFLSELHHEFGEWKNAAGAFHSRNTTHSNDYLRRFLPILASLSGDAPRDPTPDRRKNKLNQYPLLNRGTGGQKRGSLFPTEVAPRGSLFSSSNR